MISDGLFGGVFALLDDEAFDAKTKIFGVKVTIPKLPFESIEGMYAHKACITFL